MFAFRRTFKLLSEAPVANATTAAAGSTKPQLAFSFTRTASNKLPVYIEYITAKRVPVTVLRKYTGDVDELKKQVQRLVGPYIRVESSATGKITINGNYATKLRNWLEQLGF